jgi:hypothetical protein
MHLLSESEMLSVWERCRSSPPMQQAIALLAYALPDIPMDVLMKMEVGRRDALLIRLREGTFGPSMAGEATCPACGERLEVEMRTPDVLSRAPDPGALYSIDGKDYEVHFKLPNSFDLSAIRGLEDLESAWRILLERCIQSIYHEGREVPLSYLPPEAMKAVTASMEQIDPQGDVTLDLSCISCGHKWQIVFDIVAFFWSEIDAWAYRTLLEVHALARAYGWSETDILAISPWRRQVYLQMVGE